MKFRKAKRLVQSIPSDHVSTMAIIGFEWSHTFRRAFWLIVRRYEGKASLSLACKKLLEKSMFCLGN